ncbi:hypothetical protein [Rossellomorea arthrocnemi]|uniref:hypothetical protein n=1 Tax=Rossellomorea arthrocnemi TaxID=2769542 RepID=UPI0019197326|nr:hypothetical protein [Rossellomorea arthrocnemi]
MIGLQDEDTGGKVEKRKGFDQGVTSPLSPVAGYLEEKRNPGEREVLHEIWQRVT